RNDGAFLLFLTEHFLPDLDALDREVTFAVANPHQRLLYAKFQEWIVQHANQRFDRGLDLIFTQSFDALFAHRDVAVAEHLDQARVHFRPGGEFAQRLDGRQLNLNVIISGGLEQRIDDAGIAYAQQR